MNKIAHFLLQYIPFKWFSVCDSKEENVFKVFRIGLYIQFSIILLTIICFFIFEISKVEPTVNTLRTWKAYAVSLFVVILLQYLSYFTVNEIPFFILNIGGLIVNVITICNGFGQLDEPGGIVTNSMFTYYKKIERQEDLLITFQKKYDELIKFKI